MARAKKNIKRGKINQSDKKIIVSAISLLILFITSLLYLYKNPTVIDDLIRKSTRVQGDGYLYIHYINVGQGDSEMFVLPTGEVMLIDAGPNVNQNDLIYYLESHEIKQIDYFVLTHPHEDHIGGADYILDNYPVKNVIMSNGETDTAIFERVLNAIDDSGANVIIPEAGDSFSLGEGSFTILGPIGSHYKELNDWSIVLRFDYGSTSFIMTGDCETLGETEMLMKFPLSAFECDILKVGHHGSDTSSSEEFLNAVSARIAVIECGDNNYNHPNSNIVKRLESHVMTVYRTDMDAPIIFKSDGKAVTRYTESIFK